MRNWLSDYGYRNIRMPIVEDTRLFVRSVGEATDIVERKCTPSPQPQRRQPDPAPEAPPRACTRGHQAQSAVQHHPAAGGMSARCSATSARKRPAIVSFTRSAWKRWANGPDIDAGLDP